MSDGSGCVPPAGAPKSLSTIPVVPPAASAPPASAPPGANADAMCVAEPAACPEPSTSLLAGIRPSGTTPAAAVPAQVCWDASHPLPGTLLPHLSWGDALLVGVKGSWRSVTDLDYLPRNLLAMGVPLVFYPERDAIQHALASPNTSLGRLVAQTGYKGMFIPPAFIAAEAIFGNSDKARLHLAAQVTTAINTMGFKLLTNMERPHGASAGSNDRSPGFPSGHTSELFAWARTIEHTEDRRWAIPAYAVATFVGASRVVGNRHYLYQVVAGALVGINGADVAYDTFQERGRQVTRIRPTAGPNGSFGFMMARDNLNLSFTAGPSSVHFGLSAKLGGGGR